MPIRGLAILVSVALAGLLIAPLDAQQGQQGQRGRGAGGPPPTAQAAAPFDMTGYWVSLIAQDWRLRMLVPPKGDYMGIPMNAASKKIADAWDPARDEAAGEQCKGYGAAGIMRHPGRLHITWQDANTLRMDIDAGMQTRVFHFGDRKTSVGPASWQGDSVASWTPRRVLAAPSSPRARGLKVVTTNLRPAYLRRNGIPVSGQATLTEYYDVFQEPNGEAIMIVSLVVDDAVYLENPLVVSAQFKKEPDGSKWDPTPCSTKW
jgi:hypothetical protein